MADKGYRTNQENLADYLALCSLYLSGLEQGADHKTLAEQAAVLDARIAAREKIPCPAYLTFPTLWQRFELNGVEAFCVLFALCCELDGELRGRVRALTGSSVPTFDLALALCRMHHPVRIETAFRSTDLHAGPLGRLFREELHCCCVRGLSGIWRAEDCRKADGTGSSHPLKAGPGCRFIRGRSGRF